MARLALGRRVRKSRLGPRLVVSGPKKDQTLTISTVQTRSGCIPALSSALVMTPLQDT